MIVAGLSAVVIGAVLFAVGWSVDPDGDWALSQQEWSGILIRAEGRVGRACLGAARAIALAARVLGRVAFVGGIVLAVVGGLSRL